MKKNEQIKLEEKQVKRYLPKFRMYERNGLFFFSGWVETGLGRYKLRLLLDKQHPYEAPRLFLVSPKVLYTADGRSINSLGVSHRFYTESNGPGGCIQISYTGEWDASNTCTAAIMKGIVWINVHGKHRHTGRDFKWL